MSVQSWTLCERTDIVHAWKVNSSHFAGFSFFDLHAGVSDRMGTTRHSPTFRPRCAFWTFYFFYQKILTLHPDLIWHLTSPSGAPSHVRRYRIWIGRPCTGSGDILEIHPRTGAVQPHHSKHSAVAIDCVRERERSESGGNIDHVVQVCSSFSVIYGVATKTLLSLLFAGLLINRETVNSALQFLHTISFFHAGFEALAVNELRYLSLKEHKVSHIFPPWIYVNMRPCFSSMESSSTFLQQLFFRRLDWVLRYTWFDFMIGIGC